MPAQAEALLDLDRTIVAGEVGLTQALGVPSRVAHPNPNAWLLWSDLSVREDRIEEYAVKRFRQRPKFEAHRTVDDFHAALRAEAERMAAAWSEPESARIERTLRLKEGELERLPYSIGSHGDLAMRTRMLTEEIAALREQQRAAA